jgi:hypothetical protein
MSWPTEGTNHVEIKFPPCVSDNSAGQYNVIQSCTLTFSVYFLSAPWYVFTSFFYLSTYLRTSISLSLSCRFILTRRRTSLLDFFSGCTPCSQRETSRVSFHWQFHFFFYFQSTCYRLLKHDKIQRPFSFITNLFPFAKIVVRRKSSQPLFIPFGSAFHNK